MYAKTWLIRVFGQRNYEKLWFPLLRSKFGAANSETSGAYIWAAIKRYYGTRHKSSKKEMMGCVKDGYHSILKNIKHKISESGAIFLLNSEVNKLDANSSEKLRVHISSGMILDFDRVVATIPNPQIIRLWPDMSKEFRNHLEKIQYLSLICVTLLLKRPLRPFYVTNLTDEGFPFTGVIDASNVIDEEILKGRGTDFIYRDICRLKIPFLKSDEEVLEVFIKSLRIIFPNLSNRQYISARRVNRESYVQPIQIVDYSIYIPHIQTPLQNFFMVNTTMIMNSTLNNNEVIKLSRRAADLIG